MNGKYTLIKKVITFDAAQYLPQEFGKCHNLHGHTYTIENLRVSTKGIVDLSKFKEVINEFDHCVLTTTEHEPQIKKIADFMIKEGIDIFNMKYIAIPKPMVTVEYLGEYIRAQLLGINNVEDAQFEIFETPTQGVTIP